MTWLYRFVREHHKDFSVGEWGVAPNSGGNTTSENPPFTQWMHDWFVAHSAHLAYEAYFNNCDSWNIESNLYRPVSDTYGRQNLEAGSVYKSLFGS